MGLCPLHAGHQPSFLVDPSQAPVLLPRLWPRRCRNPLRRTVSPSEVPAGRSVAAAMARIAANLAESRGFLSHAVTPPRRGRGLLEPTRRPLVGTRRAYAHR